MEQNRRRQQRKACDICRRRKVRCDIELSLGGPCSVCRKSGIKCQSTTQWARPRRRRTTAAENADTAVAAAAAPGRDALEPGRTPSHTPQARGSGQGVGNSPEACYTHTRPATNADPGSLWTATGTSLPSLPTGMSTAPGRRGGGVETQAGDALNAENAGARQDDLARHGLARFLKQGINAGIWSVFNTSSEFRIAYVGTSVSNLAHLVDLHSSYRREHQPLLSSPATAADPVGLGRALHYPYPPIRSPKSWKPTIEDWGFFLAPDLAADVASFPLPEVRDALVTAYFRDVHPTLPVVSKPEFLAAYRTPGHPPPLMLFQAVLMAGATACTHPLVARDRHAVKSILFRRAALLYHTRHETDRIHMMQAALLFTWHVGDGDTISGGPWYWTGTAVRIGYGLGVHRRNPALPALETSQYRRCWWLAFISEVLSALETGRPCAVQAADTDQTLMTERDLTDRDPADTTTIHAGGSGDPFAVASPTRADPSPLSAYVDTASATMPAPSAAEADGAGRTGVNGDGGMEGGRASFINRTVELCFIGLDIIALSAPSQRRLMSVESIDARLGLWSLRAGIISSSSSIGGGGSDYGIGNGHGGAEDSRSHSPGGGGGDGDDNSGGPGSSSASSDTALNDTATRDAAKIERCHLSMYYNLMLLHLHRRYNEAPPPTPSSRAVCAAAARAIIGSLETLIALGGRDAGDSWGGLASCHFTVVGAVTAAAIQTAHELREAALARSFLVVIPALEQLARLLRVAARLARHWPNAQAVYDVFHELHQEYETYVTQDLRGEQAIVPESQPDWELILAGVQVPPMANPVVDEGWLNIPNQL
ncbi:acetamidase regulatory protein [Niveomyces insectorum RCEF 264]|uniref:Acetamidase regulatory protein n=1 Tax=Niveomyces insectorum RCEF 264 TaxID=1081102 RepID=A0A167T7A9_9HYPO|nr:acetamidase regulatory protein [Niveomyces insectorum RCEF 264]